MTDKRLSKWKYGLIVLGVLSVGLLGYTVYQGAQSRGDKQTYKKAQQIATKLNKYINEEQKVPFNLQDAGINDVPGTISYSKQASDKYEFCVTYKSANVDVGSSVSNELTKATYGGYSSSDSSYNYEDNSSSYTPSDLYIDGTHKAGKQCQTVEPYISSYNDYDQNYNDYNYNGDSGASINYDNTYLTQ